MECFWDGSLQDSVHTAVPVYLALQATMSLSAGSTLGPYTIRAELRHGGIGVVYTAHAPRLKRQHDA